MSEIKIERNADDKRLNELGVFSWPTWAKEESEFPWYYDEQETCYFVEGNVEVFPEDGKSVKIGKGDLVTFPKGMSCTWKISAFVKKHYNFG